MATFTGSIGLFEPAGLKCCSSGDLSRISERVVGRGLKVATLTRLLPNFDNIKVDGKIVIIKDRHTS
jgi:hypothetical protein